MWTYCWLHPSVWKPAQARSALHLPKTASGCIDEHRCLLPLRNLCDRDMPESTSLVHLLPKQRCTAMTTAMKPDQMYSTGLERPPNTFRDIILSWPDRWFYWRIHNPEIRGYSCNRRGGGFLILFTLEHKPLPDKRVKREAFAMVHRNLLQDFGKPLCLCGEECFSKGAP